MKRRLLKTLVAVLAIAAAAAGPVRGQNASPDVTLDFTTNDWGLPTSGNNHGPESYSNGTYSITLSATTSYRLNSGYLLLGKSGSYLELPEFSSPVEKIEVVGNSAASGSVKQNIYVGATAVSTQTTGAKGTNTYVINENYRAAGNIYTLRVESAQNTQITYIKVYYVSSGGGSGSQTTTTYNVTFGGFNEPDMNTTVNVASLPHTFTGLGDYSFVTYTVISEDCDDFTSASVTSGGEGKVSANMPNSNQMTITVTGTFEGTATIHVTGIDYNENPVSCDITVSCVVVGGGSTPEPPTPGQNSNVSWVLTPYGDLQTGDTVVIVDKTSARALPNNGGTSSTSSAVEIELSGDQNALTAAPAATLKWVVVLNNGNYQFRKPGTDDQFLYCINTFAGVRVGDNDANQFTFENGGPGIGGPSDVPFLKNTGISRYLGVYNNQEWRCYTSISSDIENTVIGFYVRTGAAPAVPHTVRFAAGNDGWTVTDVDSARSATAPAVLQNVMAGDSLVVTAPATLPGKVKSVKAVKYVAPALNTINVSGQTFYYATGENWGQAIANHPTENAGWSVSGDGVVLYNGENAVVIEGVSVYDSDSINPTGTYTFF